MVRPNLWIDRKPSPRTAVASQQASYGSGSQAGGPLAASSTSRTAAWSAWNSRPMIP